MSQDREHCPLEERSQQVVDVAWGHGLQRPGVFGATSAVRGKGQAQWALYHSVTLVV